MPTPDDMARDAEKDFEAYWGICRLVGNEFHFRATPLAELTKDAMPTWIRRARHAEQRIAALERDLAAAQKFKAWVHGWLDSVGVPHDPEPEHTAEHGCRISGRMQWLLQQRDNAVAAEREECAKAADEVVATSNRDAGAYEVGRANAGCKITAAIRARGESLARKCDLCDGTKGRQYFFGQSDVVTVDCPKCAGGSQEKWDTAEKDWAKR